MADTSVPSDAKAIIDAVTQLSGVCEKTVPAFAGLLTAAEIPYLVLPAGQKVQSLKAIIDEFKTKPDRRVGTATLQTEASFIAQVNRFKSANTVIFANGRAEDQAHMVAVLDYHPAGSDATMADFGKHRALYPFPLSAEWDAWTEQNNNVMSQSEFAAFLETRIVDVRAVEEGDITGELDRLVRLIGGTIGSPQRLLEISRTLEINVNASLKSARRLESGEMELAYQEAHTGAAGAALNIPNLFVISIPVFEDGTRYLIACRLRYRASQGGQVTWFYSIQDPNRYVDHAFAQVVERVGKATSVPTVYGAPEV